MLNGRVEITVNADSTLGEIDPIWRSIGYDEINWTYLENGRKLLAELKKLGNNCFYVRNHNIFTSFSGGNGIGGPPETATNCYSEDINGNPVFDWRTVDKVYDTFVELGHRPIVEIGFMPSALSSKDKDERYPPKDYNKWMNLCRKFAEHLIGRYGLKEVREWYFSVWNEPDIEYWMPDIPNDRVDVRAKEYCRLYDFTVEGILQAHEYLRVGGPEIAGPSYENPGCGGFLEIFLEHCVHGPNFATGENKTRMDFISMHGKATGRIDNSVPSPNLYYMIADKAKSYRNIIGRFPELKETPILLDEWDIDFGTHSGLKNSGDFCYRNNAYFAVFLCRMVKELLDMKFKDEFNVKLATQWTFFHPDSHCFEGRRHLATYGSIVKPVFNAFHMLEKLSGRRLMLESDDKTVDCPYCYSRRFTTVDALATRDDRQGKISMQVLFWNQVRDQYAVGSKEVRMRFVNLPMRGAVKVEHYRIDGRHSNACAVWQELGSLENPDPELVGKIRKKEGLEKIRPDEIVNIASDTYSIDVEMPMHSVSLLTMTTE